MKKYDNFPEERKEYAALILNEVERRYGHTILWQAPREQEAFSIDLAESAKVCCFTGNRPEKLSRSEKEVKKLLVGSILDSYEVGYRVFISGMARGVDQWAAMVVLTLRCFYSDIRLVAALPFPATKKQSIDEETMILYEANETITLSEKYWRGAYEKRNKWMVEMSNRVIALCDAESGGTQNTIRYAKKIGKEIIICSI